MLSHGAPMNITLCISAKGDVELKSSPTQGGMLHLLVGIKSRKKGKRGG